MTRKDFLSTLVLGVAAARSVSAQVANFTLPKLPYAYNALEPYIDATTMEIHHTKHHQAYVTNLNKALESVSGAPSNLDDIIKNISKYSVAVRNNGGGHWNHSFFWRILSPEKNEGSKKLLAHIQKDFGSLDKLKDEFNKAATGRFGSGWAWLILQKDGKLKVTSTANQDNPYMDVVSENGCPLIGIDVWEHAYYLKYQNKRADYINAFWNVVNWKEVDKIYNESLKKK